MNTSATLNKRSFNLRHKVNDYLAKLEDFFFTDCNDNEQTHSQIFEYYFEENYTLPKSFMIVFEKEMQIGLLFNYFHSLLFIAYVPVKFRECWTCDPVMTTWIVLLSFTNTLLLLPKLLLLRRIKRILCMTSNFESSYAMWTFFKSKIYRFNNQVSKYSFIIHVIGSLLIWWSKLSNCLLFFTVSSFTIVFFIARILWTISHFNKNFQDHQQSELLLEYYNNITSEKITSLKGSTFDELQKGKKNIEHQCSICYEDYLEGTKIKIMECPGEHVFHYKCIDRWLLKSEKCPLCNYSVFHSRNQKKEQ